jgi:alkylhydroperoxidase/carboxymuconolactone decarboxylase family protein YurZ
MATRWEEHYMREMGFIPPRVPAFMGLDPGFADSFISLRELLLQERPEGLSRAHKELLMTVLDVAGGNKQGAIHHLRAAKDGGLTQTQLLETIFALFFMHGLSGIAYWKDLWDDYNGTAE